MDVADYHLHRVIAAWLQVGAVIVAGIALAFSLRRARVERRTDLASAAYEGMVRFLEMAVRNPELGLLESQVEPQRSVSPAAQQAARAAYLLLLLTYERTYRYARWTKQPERMLAMRQMVAAYAGAPLFQEACRQFAAVSDDAFAQHLIRLVEGNEAGDPGAS